MNTICLNMIVKNERHVILRCLEAVKRTIDYWVIVDTGSTDGTQELIREYMRGTAGELHERPWRGFEYNRNEALDLARGKANYVLFLDADEKIHILPSFQKKKLIKDYYFAKIIGVGQEFYFPKIVRNDPSWSWVGKLHESLRCDRESEGEWSTDFWVESKQDGARSRDPERDQKDIALLEEMVQENPRDSRPYFYLAQTYFNMQDWDRAYDYYKARGEMEGAHDETFWSLFFAGQIEELRQKGSEQAIQSYLKAYKFDPLRAEPLERIANLYLQDGRFVLGYILMKHAKSLPRPTPSSAGYYGWVYEFGIDALCADFAAQIGLMQEAGEIYRRLLAKPTSPPALRTHAEKQLATVDLWNKSKDKKGISFATLPIQLVFRFR